MSWPRQSYLYYLPVLLLGLFFIWKSQTAPIFDFSNYYFGGRFVAEGNFTDQVYLPDFFNQQITAWEGKPYFNSYAPNTPFLSLVFYLFSGLDALTAKTVFQLLSLTVFIFSLHRLLQHYRVDQRWVLVLPVILFIPFRNEVLFGQVYLLVFVLLAESLIAWEKGKWWMLSILLSFAIVFKLFPIYLALPLLFSKAWKPLLGTGIMVLVWIGLSVLVSGADVWWFYFQEVFSRAGRGEISSAYVDNYQSVLMFLKRMLVFDPVENPGAWKHLPGLYIGLNSGLKVLVVIIGWYLHRAGKSTLSQFAYWILVSFVISPYGSTYTYVLLIFPLLVVLHEFEQPRLRFMFLILVALLCFAPLGFIIQLPYPFSYLRLFVLLLVFSVFIYGLRVQLSWKWTGTLSATAVLMVTLFGKAPASYSKHWLKPDSPVLINSMVINPGGIDYTYLDAKGKHEQHVWMIALKRKKLTIKNKQIFDGDRQLTSDPSFKRDAWLLSDTNLFYLSDEGAGIGFFTIRFKQIK